MFTKFISLLLVSVFSFSALASNVPQAGNVVNSGAAMNSANPTQQLPPGTLPITLQCVEVTAAQYEWLSSWSSPASGGRVQFQVPSTQTFVVTSILYQSGLTATGLILGYGTAALGSKDTATPPTGSTPYGDVTNANGGIFSQGTAQTQFSIPVTFPASSFPYCFFLAGSGTANAFVTGYLTP